MTPTIQFQHVSKKYNLGMTRTSVPSIISDYARNLFKGSKSSGLTRQTYWALNDVSFELERGDSLALVGANGAGKTTTLKLLAKITRPTSGHIAIRGQLSALIELGAGFHPDLSGRENIFLNGAILGLKNNDILRRLDQIVSFAELEKFIDTPVKRYSSGMVVRLGFAVAASIDPDILLVDEVLAVGDSTFRLKCMKRIQELIDNGTTLIFVSHNMGLVKAVCQKALYIEKGNMRLFGSTNDVIEAYNRDLNQQRMAQFNRETGSTDGISATANITRLEVKSLDAENNNTLISNRPACIRIHYSAYQDLGDVSLVLRVIRSDGVFCAVMYSRLDQAPLSINRGSGQITTRLDPLQLYPGTYYVVATLKNQNESLTHDMAYSEWFHVEGELAGYEDLDAVYEPNRIWQHQPVVSGELLTSQ
jgi:lipopolysaccharide transport system ATP-binding protein